MARKKVIAGERFIRHSHREEDDENYEEFTSQLILIISRVRRLIGQSCSLIFVI